jgi:ketosteroid isomerase-like protein
MRGRTRQLLRLSTLVAVVAAVTVSAPTNARAQSDEEAVKQTLVDMWDAIEQGDVARYATYIHDDFTSFGENDTYLNEGKEYELRSVAGWIEGSADIHTEMHQPEVTIVGDVAWITYYWTDSSISRASGEVGSSRGKSTRIFVREGDRWLCIHGHYTLVD